jgi:hypothetical protein
MSVTGAEIAERRRKLYGKLDVNAHSSIRERSRLQFLINITNVGLASGVRFLPLLFGVIGSAQHEALLQVNGDKDGDSTVQHHRPPPPLGGLATHSWTPGFAVMPDER